MDQKERRERQLKGILEDTLESASKAVTLEEDAIERLLGNSGKLREDLIASLIKHSAADDRFFLLSSFTLTVPEDYDHSAQLASFAKYAKQEKFYYYNDDITDENFKKTTHKLVPGKTYMVKIFSIRTRVTSKDCMAFLATQQAILVGAQGLSLARQLKKDEFPMGKWTVSFDCKDALWEDADGDHRVPFVFRRSDGDWWFYLGCFANDWNGGFCLLCFGDLPAGEAGE